MKVILASASPRRQELLKLLVPEFSINPAEIDESVLPSEKAEDYVRRLALGKAMKIAGTFPEALIIGSDTTVVLNNEILGKPENVEEAYQTLKKLSGQTHHVLTAISLVCRKNKLSITECSDSLVTFDKCSETELRKYAASGEPLDKAGAYAIQGGGALFVKSINGTPSGIIGLDINLLKQMLKKVGII